MDRPTVNALGAWRKLSGSAFGRWLFTRIVCFKAPYFGTISPIFDVLEPGRAVARIRKRRKVQNHIGTVHAIAMANLCELVAGTLTEVSIPADMRWIPRGMQINYVAKAETDIHAEASFPEIAGAEARDVVVPVRVMDGADNVVVTADITMYVSPRSATRGRS
ncbi:MAG: hotdog fold domain-containing protein [Woeseiaceae bacterium]|nr:hotdog fold domain-containing protein [Woeseiaceae bacterium]